MTRSEYKDLVEFLGRKFDAIDRRFDALDARVTRVEILCEENRHQIQIVAEGVVSLREEMVRRFEALEARVSRLEAKVA